jgi:hypothetical protein
MGLHYKNLDEKTRAFMLQEIEHDITEGTLYMSGNLNEFGRATYPELLKNAANNGTDALLAAVIQGRLNAFEKPRELKSGGFSKAPVMRVNAHEMLAEGEFNRFYMRAICLRAIEAGNLEVVVYRAKAVENPRSESQQKIGQHTAARALLRDLRANIGVDTSLGLPPGPNSGLSVHLA